MIPQHSGPIEVFYSYSHKDEELRDELEKHLSMLRREGVIQNWHDRKIVAGAKWGGDIDEHLVTADIVFLLVSPDFLASDYCYDIEVKLAIDRHKAGLTQVIPIILRPCDWASAPFGQLQALPKDARPVTTWADRDSAFIDIVEAIRKISQRPSASPGKSIGPPRNIPRPPIVGFVVRRDNDGRDIVKRLKEELGPQKNQLIALSGPGGVGKTTLAAEVTRALIPDYEQRVVWISALGDVDFALSMLLNEIATNLGEPRLRTLAPEAKAEQVQALLASAPTLVILDNFETIAPTEQERCVDFLVHHAACSALITTRQRIPSARNITIPVMSSDEAEGFLERLIEQASDPDAFAQLDRDRILKASERNPLVLQWVVAQIDLAQDAETVLNDLAHGAGDAAQRVFDRSFDLEQLGDNGRATLLALSLFAPDASRSGLAEVAGFGQDRRLLNLAVKRLADLWLVKTAKSGSRLAVEGLTRALAKASLMKNERVDEFRQRFVAYFLNYAESHADPTPSSLDALEAEKDNVLGAMDIASNLGDWTSVMKIYPSLVEFLDLRGYWDEAIRRGEQAVQAAEAVKADGLAAGFAGNIAMIRIRRGEYDEGRRSFRHVLDSYRKLGSEIGVSSSLHNLGSIAHTQGELETARQLYNESLQIEKKLGNQRGIAVTLHNLGMIAQTGGQLDEARQLYNQSLQIEKQLRNPRGIAVTLHQLGVIAQNQRDFEQAQELYLESLEIKKRLGDQSGIASTLHQLGTIAEQREELGEARRLFYESLEIAINLGDQRSIATTLNNLAALAQRQEDLSEARRLYNESLAIKRRLNDLRGIASTLQNLALLATHQGDPTEARRIYEESLAIWRKLGDKRRVESGRANLEVIAHRQLESDHQKAEQLMQEGRWREARDILERNKEEFRNLQDREGFARTLLALAQSEQAIGDLERARWTYKDALDQFQSLDQRYVAITSVYLGRLELQTGLVKDALTHLSDAETYFGKVNGEPNLVIVRQLLDAAKQLATKQLDDESWFSRTKLKKGM